MAQSSKGRGAEKNRRGQQDRRQGNPASAASEPQSGIYYTDQQPLQGQKRTLTPAQKKARQQRRQEILRRRRRHRRIFYAIVFLIVVFGAFFLIRHFTADEDAEEPKMDELDSAEEEEDYNGPPVATIAFVGDISTSSDQAAAAARSDGTYDFSQAFSAVEPYISEADYAVGDFETTMVSGLAYGLEPYYNAPVQLAGSLHNLGFDLMSTANTYMLSNGIEGLTSTKNYLSEAKLKTVGTYLSQEERDKNGGAYLKTIHGIKFAFLAYTKGTDSVRMPEGCEYALNTLYSDYSDYWTELKSTQIRSDVQAARDAGAEVIIALVHWGSEYGRSIGTPQQKAADLLKSCGVDAIIGSHSHLVGEMGYEKAELSDGTTKACFVAYSLGDFYTDPEREDAQSSVILNLTFTKDASGNVSVTDASYVPIYQNITEENGKRKFELVDVYQDLAELQRQEELNSTQAKLYNGLLETIDTLHAYAGEELDAGPAERDRRLVAQAIEDGPISTSSIRAKEKTEKAEAEAAQDALDGEDSAQTPEESPMVSAE